jgi:hypothetical protein
MAALSPAQANVVSLWFVVFLAVLLALSLAAVIVSPPRADSPAAEGAEAEPDLPEPGHEPSASPLPLPRRVAGQSWAAYPAGDPGPSSRRDPATRGVRRPALGTGAQAARRPVRSRAPPAGLTPRTTSTSCGAFFMSAAR